MLVLSRRRDETVVIETSDGPVEVVVVSARGGCVKLGFIAPRETRIHRGSRRVPPAVTGATGATGAAPAVAKTPRALDISEYYKTARGKTRGAT